MADLKFEINIDELSNILKEKVKEVEKDLEQGVEGLSRMMHAKLLELADEKLGSVSQLYRDNVEYVEPVNVGGEKIWIVQLNQPALWIEDGRKVGFMEELLHGKSSKVSKDGKRYAVIPFKHNENPSKQTSNAQQLASQIKEAMKDKGITWGKIERNSDGSPRVGKLHSFNVESAKAKESHKSPLTHGVNIYQTQRPDGSVRRDIMTFRIIHEDHKEEGKWIYPDNAKYAKPGAQLMEEAFDWATTMWDQEIFPKILEKHGK